MEWTSYNPNPRKRRVEDCSVRAIAKALGVDWDTAYWMLAEEAHAMGDMMHSDAVWGKLLKNYGFSMRPLLDRCPDCYTAADFAADHPRGTYVLAFGCHVATVKDGRLYDSFNSSGLVPVYYWQKG